MTEQFRPRAKQHDGSRGLLIVVLAIVTVAGVSVFGCGAFLFLNFLLPVRTPDADVQTPEEKRAELQAAFSAPDVGLPPAELQELERLFGRLTDVATDSDLTGFQQLVHLERLHAEMHRSGLMPEQVRLFDMLLLDSLADQLWLPMYATRYHIVHVDRVSEEPEEAVVYAYFWDAELDATEMRIWVTRDRGHWEIFDWEMLQFGMRASREIAIYQSPGVETYSELFIQLNRADRFFNQGDYENGAERLRQCEALLPEITEQLREQARTHILFYWIAYGYYAEADQLARRAVSPLDTPGALYAQIVYQSSRGAHELVLELCDQYEHAIGPGPNVARYRSQALYGLERDVEANAARAQYLAWDPDNIDVLADYALDLGPSDKGRLAEVLNQASEPVETARTLAEHCSWYGDREALSAILSVLASREAASEVCYVTGLLLELEGADHKAAAEFHEALQLRSGDPGDQSLWKYLDCMHRLGRVLEAYENAPNADEAFAYFANGDPEAGVESRLSPVVLRDLAEAHSRRSPNDPWWAGHLGNLHFQGGDTEQALEYYEVGLSLLKQDTDAEADWMLKSQRRDCLVAAGRWREAYSTGDSVEEEFRSLAGELIWREQFDILRDLVELHRGNCPDDPLGLLYAGRLALRDRRFDEARALFDEASSLFESEDYGRDQVRAARVELQIAAGNPLEAYGSVPPDEDTFSQLATHFMQLGEFDSLLELIALRRQDAPDDVEPLYQQVRAEFSREDYSAALDTIAATNPELVDSLEYYRRSEWDRMHLRSLLRTGQFPAAIELARDVSRRESDSRALIVALCCSGEYDEARSLLEGYADVSYDSIYDDRDAGTILTGDTFRAARRVTPPGLPTVSTTPLVALLDRPLETSMAELQPQITRMLGPDAHIEPLHQPNDSRVRTFVVSTDRPEFLIVCGDGLFQEDLSRMHAGFFAGTGRWKAVVSHEAWCAFTLIHHDAPGGPDTGRLADLRQLAGRFFGDEWLAWWDGGVNRIVVPADGLEDLLLNPDSMHNIGSAGETLWLYRSLEDFDRQWILQERVRRLLHGAVRKWIAAEGSASLEVVALIDADPAGELMRVRVESIRRSPWFGWTLKGHLITDSQLAPWRRAGEPIHLDSGSVMDWTLTEGAHTSHAWTEARQWWEQSRGAAEHARLSE